MWNFAHKASLVVGCILMIYVADRFGNLQAGFVGLITLGIIFFVIDPISEKNNEELNAYKNKILELNNENEQLKNKIRKIQISNEK